MSSRKFLDKLNRKAVTGEVLQKTKITHIIQNIISDNRNRKILSSNIIPLELRREMLLLIQSQGCGDEESLKFISNMCMFIKREYASDVFYNSIIQFIISFGTDKLVHYVPSLESFCEEYKKLSVVNYCDKGEIISEDVEYYENRFIYLHEMGHFDNKTITDSAHSERYTDGSMGTLKRRVNLVLLKMFQVWSIMCNRHLTNLKAVIGESIDNDGKPVAEDDGDTKQLLNEYQTYIQEIRLNSSAYYDDNNNNTTDRDDVHDNKNKTNGVDSVKFYLKDMNRDNPLMKSYYFSSSTETLSSDPTTVKSVVTAQVHKVPTADDQLYDIESESTESFEISKSSKESESSESEPSDSSDSEMESNDVFNNCRFDDGNDANEDKEKNDSSCRKIDTLDLESESSADNFLDDIGNLFEDDDEEDDDNKDTDGNHSEQIVDTVILDPYHIKPVTDKIDDTFIELQKAVLENLTRAIEDAKINELNKK